NLPAILPRVPALSEHGWTPDGPRDYQAFSTRMAATDKKLRQLLFPGELHKDGLTDGIPHERYYNRENYFTDTLSLSITSKLPGVDVRYTTNGQVPLPHDRKWIDPVRVDATTMLRIALYKDGQMVGYKSELLEK